MEESVTEQEISMNSLQRDLENIASLQANLLEMAEDSGHSESEEMEVDKDSNPFEEDEEEEDDDVMLDDDVVEVEIETETEPERELSSPILEPQVIPQIQSPVKVVPSTTTLKAIAPKPVITQQRAGGKANIIQTGGQQIVLIHSPGGTANAVSLSTGQPIKLITQSGQPVTLPQLQSQRQQLVKTTDGNLILRTTLPKTNNQAGVLKTSATLKRFIQPVAQKKPAPIQPAKPESSTQIKIISSSASGTTPGTMCNPSKTISLQQAQEMGLITTTQIQQLLPHSVGSNKIVINKSGAQKQTPTLIKVASNQFTKSPTKILPAPKFVQKAGQQKVLIKQGNQLKTGIINTGGQQVLRIPANQLGNAGQIHQINLPGQGVQYVRLVNTSTNNSTVSTSSSVNTVVRAVASSGQQQKLSTIVPVALVDSSKVINARQSLVKVLPIASSGTSARPVAPKIVPSSPTQKTIVASSGSSQEKVTVVPSPAVNQIPATTILPTSPGNSIVVLPTQFVQQLQQEVATHNVPKSTSPTTSGNLIPKTEPKLLTESTIQEIGPRPSSSAATSEPNGLRPRKPCNCTKSQCLKLYCDCFANGEFCYMCNCVNCFNNLRNEEERHKAIRSCLERNPSAFRPKIGKGRDHSEHAIRKHTKGCNCKRSGCLKNYCECYEAKIACSSNCKCVGCRNIEDSLEKKSLRPIAPLINMGENSLSPINLKPQTPIKSLYGDPFHKGRYLNYSTPNVAINFRPMLGNHNKQAFAFMTSEVIEATVQCLLASAEMAEKKGVSASEEESTVLKEFGRCLVEIINTAKS